MAKTIDDLIVEISGLVKVLNKQNSESGGKPGQNSFHLTGDLYQNFAGEIQSLAETAKRLSEAQSNFATEIAKTGNSKWHQYRLEMVDNMKKSQAMMEEFQEEFGHSGRRLEKDIKEYIDTVAKLKSEEASIQEKIVAKKEVLAETEQKLINDELEIKLAELEARRNHKEELEKISNETKEISKKLAEHNQILSQKRKEKENEENRVVADDEVLQKRIRKSEDDEKNLINKRKYIDQTHREGQNIKTKLKQGGYNKKGKKASHAEAFEIFGNIRSYFKENSKGRIFADGVNTATQVGVGAAKMVQSGKMDVSGMADKATQALSKLGPYGAAAGGVVQLLKVGFEMFAKVDKAAADYARTVGGGAYNMKKMRLEATQLAKEMSKFGKTAYLAEEILARMGEASEAFGRNLEGLSTNDLRSLQDLKNFGVDDQSIAQFDTFGVSVHNVSKQLADLYGESGKRGLNAKATIKAFTSNLKMAQNYTFARGQKALMDMAMKSAQLKFNLRDAEQFANKVSTLEGAMTAGAQLSVLGGNFAMQGNPLAMMYNSLYDVEGLQNQMLAMTKGMAKWNYSTNQLDISAFDRERLKAMAQVSGIDYSDLTSQALNQARVDRVSAQLGNGFSKEEEEYIKNLAALDEKGNAYIRVGDKEYNMSDIKADKDGVRRQLKAQSEAKDTKEGADMGDIWSETRGIQDKLDDYIKWMQSKFMNVIVKIATFFTKDDAHALKYGLEGEQLEQYNTLKKVLDDKNIKQEDINVLSEDLQKILKQNNIIDENGKLNQYTLESMRYNKDKAISWGQTAEMVSKSALMDGTLNKANGGYISGPGGPKDDAIPARLSDGEFVVNAEATARNRPFLEQINSKSNVKNGKNIMNHTSVKGYADGGAVGSSNSTYQQKVDISPIKIEFGTLELRIGDLTRVLNSNEIASKLLNNTPFIDNIVKEIGSRANFGYRKDDATNRCVIDPYVSGY
jgi:hypothetical protein